MGASRSCAMFLAIHRPLLRSLTTRCSRPPGRSAFLLNSGLAPAPAAAELGGVRCRYTPSRMSGQSTSLEEPRWFLVGNIVEQRRFGEGGLIVKPGTKHFSPGTKVYCLSSQWGDGLEQIRVVGRHRGARGLCMMVVSCHHITNWRAKLVYSPEVFRLVDESGCYSAWGGQEGIERWLPHILAREREWNLKHPLPNSPDNRDAY